MLHFKFALFVLDTSHDLNFVDVGSTNACRRFKGSKKRTCDVHLGTFMSVQVLVRGIATIDRSFRGLYVCVVALSKQRDPSHMHFMCI
jgi:hypothetical protein